MGILIAKKFSKKILNKIKEVNLHPFSYLIEGIDKNNIYSFEDLLSRLVLEYIGE